VSVLVFGDILPWLVVAVGCWVGFQLLRQNGRILLRFEQMERQLAQLSVTAQAAPGPPSAPPPLSLGSVAPDVELLDLSDARSSLAQ
jgi:hypothetical protein